MDSVNRRFSKRNTNGSVPPQPMDSQMPSLAGAAVVPHALNGNGGGKVGTPPTDTQTVTNGDDKNPVEVHMVYADWCGHSKKALPAFESLVNNKDIKTSSGRPVVYVLTDENSENFKQFKARGFPSYMVKDGDKIFPIDVGDRSETSIIEASKKLQ